MKIKSEGNTSDTIQANTHYSHIEELLKLIEKKIKIIVKETKTMMDKITTDIDKKIHQSAK